MNLSVLASRESTNNCFRNAQLSVLGHGRSQNKSSNETILHTCVCDHESSSAR